jgi:NAD(P)-dependent dehydrogenase (short-subunit alcohol dehydrogenase family)
VLDATAEEFRQAFGRTVQTVTCDIRDPENVEAMLDEVSRAAPLDVLVNNAAGNFIAQTHKLSARAIDSVLGICLHGTAYCTTGMGRRWIESGRPGTVLSVLTLSALMGAPFTVPSAMAKAGVDAMTKSLAVEWGPKGIRLVAVVPGSFPTEGATSRLKSDGWSEQQRCARRAAASAWRSCRTCQPLCVPRLRSCGLHHWRERRDRRRPPLSRRFARRQHRDARLDG